MALQITECCLFEEGSRSAQCNEIDFREEESAMLCTQQRATDELKGRKCGIVAPFWLIKGQDRWGRGRGKKGAEGKNDKWPERADDELRRISEKLKLNSSTLLSDITLGREDGGWRRQRQREEKRRAVY